MGTLHSRSIAEHLNTFASLLEAEAIRTNTLGLKCGKDLAREAMDVRRMANRLWDANAPIALEHSAHAEPDRPPVSDAPAVKPGKTVGLRVCS